MRTTGCGLASGEGCTHRRVGGESSLEQSQAQAESGIKLTDGGHPGFELQVYLEAAASDARPVAGPVGTTDSGYEGEHSDTTLGLSVATLTLLHARLPSIEARTGLIEEDRGSWMQMPDGKGVGEANP